MTRFYSGSGYAVMLLEVNCDWRVCPGSDIIFPVPASFLFGAVSVLQCL